MDDRLPLATATDHGNVPSLASCLMYEAASDSKHSLTEDNL